MELFFLSCGTLNVFEWLIGRGGYLTPWRTIPLSMTVGVARMDDGGVVLVDAGFSHEACVRNARNLGLEGRVLGPELVGRDSARHQLEQLGIDPASVKAIIATHMHLDHVGGVVDFPNAELIVSEPEWRAFRAGAAGYRAEDIDDPDRVRPFAYDGPGRWGFRGSHDLFGDGRLVLHDARGHTSGNLAVEMSGVRKRVLHIGDTVYHAWEYETERSSILGHYRANDSRRRDEARAALRVCAREEPAMRIVTSHDPTTFAGLRTAP